MPPVATMCRQLTARAAVAAHRTKGRSASSGTNCAGTAVAGCLRAASAALLAATMAPKKKGGSPKKKAAVPQTPEMLDVRKYQIAASIAEERSEMLLAQIDLYTTAHPADAWLPSELSGPT